MPQRTRRGTRRVPSAIYRGRQAQAKLRPRRARRGHEASIVESSVTARSRDAWWHASQGFSSANTTLSTCASGAATIARHSSSSQSERTSRSWLQQPRRHRCCSRTRRARRSTRQLAAGRRRHRPSFERMQQPPLASDVECSAVVLRPGGSRDRSCCSCRRSARCLLQALGAGRLARAPLVVQVITQDRRQPGGLEAGARQRGMSV